MNAFTKIATAGVIAVSAGLAATDAAALGFSLSGTFTFQAVNYNPLGNNSQRETRSAATEANFNDITSLTPTIGTVNGTDIFTYTGALDFRQEHNFPGTTTVSSWLNTGSGTFSPDPLPTIGGLTLSAGSGSGDGSNNRVFDTTTLFKITASSLNIADLSQLLEVTHDDGITAQGSGGTEVAFIGPNNETTTSLAGLTGGVGNFVLYYAAANGNPSILEVQAIPLPAAAWLLLAASGGLIAAKRRSARSAA